jgi:hypothetical protein
MTTFPMMSWGRFPMAATSAGERLDGSGHRLANRRLWLDEAMGADDGA